MDTIIDFHIHSHFSRACSPALTPVNLAAWADKKGIHVLGTGDFTHPGWLKELKENLVEDAPGMYKLKNGTNRARFILTSEISSIYRRGGKVRRVHNLLLAPDFKAVEKIIAALEARKCNLKADGRPIVGIDSEDLLKIALEASPDCMIIPAHAWTPWFAVFGSKSGFDSLEECFGDMTKHVTAIETGLSSDPLMNWRLSKLDDVLLVSNSDAHSLPNLGREANVFDIEPKKLSYSEILRILREKDRKKFKYTIEFYPEEGMYHFDGHRLCKTRLHPRETKKLKGICPVCKKPVTVGVLSRIDDLADRTEGTRPKGLTPYKSIVPLAEIIGEALGKGVATKGSMALYEKMMAFAPEFDILLHTSYEELTKVAPPELVEAIKRVREGKLTVEPGYDGEYGTVTIFTEQERKKAKQESLI